MNPNEDDATSDVDADVCVDLFDEDPVDLARLIAEQARKPPEWRAAADEALLWTSGQVVTVRFLEERYPIDDQVLAIAGKWCEHANLSFVLTDDRDADIRISYAGTQNMSQIGTRSRLEADAPANQPSMWLPGALDASTIDRVVLHEFGHALGLIHEHQSPDAHIPWKRGAVYSTYGALGLEWIERNWFRRYDSTSTVRHTAFDRSSIMLYPISARLVEDPSFATPLNTRLSPSDRAFVRMLYPGRPPEAPPSP